MTCPRSSSFAASEPPTYLPHVDGLRALAVALVVLYHAWPWLVPGGFIGVDVFFVISGFIITRQLALEIEGRTFSYAAFLGRRIRRLVPAAAVCCVLVTIAASAILMPEALTEFGESLAAVWTMTANVFFYLNTGYFDGPSAEAPLLHMWSLAVEDQFYLTWPLLLVLLFSRLGTRPRIVVAALALAALSLVHSEISAARDPSFAFYLPFSRAFELLAGCALALAQPFLSSPAAGSRAGRSLPVLDLAGLALVLGSAFAISSETTFPGLAVVPTVAGTALLIGVGLLRPTPVSRLLSLRPSVVAGKMSYSIYLYHWPVLALATYWLGRAPDGSEAFFLVAASLALAALSWLLVEQWATQRLALRAAPAGALMGWTAAAAVPFFLFAGAAAATRGWPQRLDPLSYDVYRAASAGNPLRVSCDGYDLALRNNARCTFGRPLGDDASYDIAVFGDSNADQFVPMIAELAQKAGLSGRQVTQSSCGPLIGASAGRSAYLEEQCARYQETVLTFLDRNPHLKIAVLSSVWSSYWPSQANRISTLAGQPSFEHFAAQTIKLFRERGIKVLVIGQIPHFRSFSLRCLAEAHRRDTEDRDCVLPRESLSEDVLRTQEALETIDRADDGVSFANMLDLLCSTSSCSAFKDDVLLYRDRGHLNAKGAEYLARFASLPPLSP
jgi:peptidoglycan/LPS O-acetylase OafA/YrhL